MSETMFSDAELDLLMAHLVKPVKLTKLDAANQRRAAREGVDFESMSAGEKAAFTRQTKAACKAAGISLD